MSRYAIGDIHGGAGTLGALLEQLQLQPSDRLFLLGDYIDRGPDSKGVLDTILQLLHSGHDVRPVRGNHDDMLLQSVTGYRDNYAWHWLREWGGVTLQSFGVKSPEELPAPYVQLLEQMPYLRVEDDFVLVHAGLDMDAADPLTGSSPLAMTWGETRGIDAARLGGRRLVTGHHPVPLPLIRMSLQSSHIYLDNGAFTGMQPEYGNLVALNLDTRELTLQPWLDGPVTQY
jgi:serine/threonine protein phosphatase 1